MEGFRANPACSSLGPYYPETSRRITLPQINPTKLGRYSSRNRILHVQKVKVIKKKKHWFQ